MLTNERAFLDKFHQALEQTAQPSPTPPPLPDKPGEGGAK